MYQAKWLKYTSKDKVYIWCVKGSEWCLLPDPSLTKWDPNYRYLIPRSIIPDHVRGSPAPTPPPARPVPQSIAMATPPAREGTSSTTPLSSFDFSAL